MMQALAVLVLLSILTGEAYGITWDFSGAGDTQGWSAMQADGRRLQQEVTEGVWRVAPPPYAADDPRYSGMLLVSPRIGHDSALFDRLRIRFRVVTAHPFEAGMQLSWSNPHRRLALGGWEFYLFVPGLSVITGEWQQVAITGLEDGADCGHAMYSSDGAPLPCYLEWEGELLELRILLPTWDWGKVWPVGSEEIAEAVEVDWIQLTGVEEQLQGELPPPEVRSEGPVGTLFEAPRFFPLEVSNLGNTGFRFVEVPGEALGDVNRDGHADVLALWHSLDDDLATGWFVAFGDGLGGFPTMANNGELAQRSICRLEGGDLDGDGDLDAVLFIGLGPAELLMNDEEKGWLRVPLPDKSLPEVMVLGVEDADGDGDADVWFRQDTGDVCVLVDQGSSPGELRCWRPRGLPSGSRAVRLVRGLGPSGVTGALWREPAETPERRHVVAYLDASGEVVQAPLGSADYRRIEGVADLDGDGDVDVLLHREEMFEGMGKRVGLQLLQNQGDGTWVETDWQPDARPWYPPTLSDVNGDGLTDVIWADATLYDPGVVVALGRAGELPRIEGRYPLHEGAGGPVLAGDVNGDGRTDLVVLEQVGYAGDGLHVLLNRSAPTAVTGEGEETDRPAAFHLGRSYPNPFNPQTWIPLEVPPAAGPVTLQVYDVLGRPVRRLVTGSLAPGRHVVVWDGRDEVGHSVAAGLYLYRLEIQGEADSGKMVKIN